MPAPTTSIRLNSTTPAAPSGQQNVQFQSDGGTPLQQISAYMPLATDSASGAVIPDGTSITIDSSGVISASGGGGGGSTSVQFGAGSPLPASPAIVQGAVGGGYFSASIAFSSNVTAGNALIVVVHSVSGTPALSDSLGTSYTHIVSATTDGFDVFAGAAPSSGANTVSISGCQYPDAAIAEVSGMESPASVLDAYGEYSGTGSNSVSVTTTNGNDITLIFVANNGSTDSYTAGTGWTIAAQGTPFDNDCIGSAIPSTVGAQSYSWTIGNTAATHAIAVALKGNSTGQAGSEGDIYFDTTTSPLTGYAYHSGGWLKFQ